MALLLNSYVTTFIEHFVHFDTRWHNSPDQTEELIKNILMLKFVDNSAAVMFSSQRATFLIANVSTVIMLRSGLFSTNIGQRKVQKHNCCIYCDYKHFTTFLFVIWSQSWTNKCRSLFSQRLRRKQE